MSEGQTNNSKQAAWVAIGSFFSFIVGIVSPMILSRYFDKGDYGTYKQVMYVYSTLLFVFTLGLPKAYSYFLPKYPKSYSKDIIRKVTLIFIYLGFAFSLVLFVFSNQIAQILNNPDLSLALKVFSPTPLFLLPTLGLDGIYATFNKTRVLAIYTVIRNIGSVVCIIIPVLLFNGTYISALIGFDISSLLSCVCALYLKTWPVKNEGHLKSPVSYKQIFSFSIPLLFASFWGMIISSANQFFISKYFGKEVFADFSNGFIEIPIVGMVISSVSTILLPLFSKSNQDNKGLFDLWVRTLEKTAKIIFPILLFSVSFAHSFMTCLYGDIYDESAKYFIIKNISSLFYIIPFAPILLAIGKTKEYANVHFFVAVLIVSLELLCVNVFNSPLSIAIVSELCQVVKIGLMMRIISKIFGVTFMQCLPWKELIRIVFAALLSSLLALTICTLLFDNKWFVLMTGLVLFVIFYYLSCFLFSISYKEILSSFIQNSRLGFILKFIP